MVPGAFRDIRRERRGVSPLSTALPTSHRVGCDALELSYCPRPPVAVGCREAGDEFKMRVLGTVALIAGLGGCAYKAEPVAAPSYNVTTSFTQKVSGNRL